jgi:RNA polymerase subunit RPABC4/transcription elongation factor Spt4
MMDEDFTCPNCGADVPDEAKACPECGADEKTGWSDDTIYDGTGIEDPDDFDYEDWQRREGVGKSDRRQVLIWMGAAVMLGLFIFLILR